MKTINKLILAAIFAIPTITNAVLFTDAEIASVQPDYQYITGKTGEIMLEANVKGLSNTSEYQELIAIYSNNKNKLKELMIAANKLNNLVENSENPTKKSFLKKLFLKIV